MDPVHQAVFAKASEQPCTIAGLDYVPCDSLMSSPQHLITLLAPLLHQCFSAQVDAILEPAFTTIDGCAHILRRLIEGDMGPWLPAQSWILMQHNELRGVSLLTQTAPHGATLQLIGVVPNIQGQGLGLGLLQHTLKQMMFGTEQQAHPLLSLEATHSTDHAASIKLYRKLGFTETGYYPHAILTRETWEKRQLAHPPWYITC
jgi:ribosomal protein S18 acetylase RimI-like enzyme